MWSTNLRCIDGKRCLLQLGVVVASLWSKIEARFELLQCRQIFDFTVHTFSSSLTLLLVGDEANFDGVFLLSLVREGGDGDEEVGKGFVWIRAKLKEKNQSCLVIWPSFFSFLPCHYVRPLWRFVLYAKRNCSLS